MNNANAKSRPALGQPAQIGTLYDAATDSFLGSIFKSTTPLPEDSDIIISNRVAAAATVKSIATDSYKDKFDLLDVSPDLGASILGGLLGDGDQSQSSLAYLCRQRKSNTTAQAALVHRLLTVKERVNRRSANLTSSIDLNALHKTRATHVVVAVEWGVETVVEVIQRRDDSQASQVQVGAAVQYLKNSIAVTDKTSSPSRPDPVLESAQLEVGVFSNVFAQAAHVHTIEEAKDLLVNQVPQALIQDNVGKGHPITCKLLPISIFMGFIGDDDDDEDGDCEALPTGASITSIGPDHLDNCRVMLEGLLANYRRITDYSNFLMANRDYVSPDHSSDIQHLAQNIEEIMDGAKRCYGQALRNVRTGSRPLSILKELQESVSGPGAPDTGIVDEQREKIEFVSGAVKSGAAYIGYYSKMRLDDFTRQQGHGGPPLFALSFGQSCMQHDSWAATKALVMELLQTECKAGAVVVIEDCDAAGQRLEAPCIAEYQNGTVTTTDVLERRKYLADKCFAQCSDNCMETQDIQKPVRRRFVKIPCPGPRCQGTTELSWMCPTCLHPLEYGHSDDYFYCDCGRSHFKNYTFKCNNSATHGQSYLSFRDKGRLQSLLQSLAASNYVNILILGETGVGKSTFINAFINYLTFDTLDDALNREDLQWVIPCSFQTQVMDRTRPDGRIIQHKISVGDDDSEHDGSKGDSATQKTSVYPITIGSRTIRLIDTPGIGDTRGVQFDKKNMADILTTLNSYEDLHGILILLKSNSARLTITFEFCVKELLTHLHKSAVHNIAFGFTNTRISNYTPGDTFGPLETLLAKQSEIQLSLTMQTSYCFDSESFRYLAANKKGIPMENEEEFRRSWKHSRDESNRLIDYFQSRPPHSVTNTISLNSTRQVILDLTKPLAEISQLIRKNIAMFHDRKRELADSRLTGDALRQKLQFERIELQKKDLDMPRTVCTDRECIVEKDDGTGNRVVEYKSHCHGQCHLEGITAETVAFPGLINCWAFMGNDHCRRCGHSWRMHLHILYEFEEVTATVTDSRIEQDLVNNAKDSDVRQKGLMEAQRLIREYEYEHQQVQHAAAAFGLYLKKNSITAYNDVTLDYLDMLINQEKEKIEVGGGRARLEALEMDRKQHVELVAALTAGMRQPHGSGSGFYTVLDEAGVDAVVRGLYGLKHFGAQLKDVQTTISNAHATTYREKPYRVGHNKYTRVFKRSNHHDGHGHIGSNSGSSSRATATGGITGILSSFSSMMGLSHSSSSSTARKGGGHRHSVIGGSSIGNLTRTKSRRQDPSIGTPKTNTITSVPAVSARCSSPAGRSVSATSRPVSVLQSQGVPRRSSMMITPVPTGGSFSQDPPPPYGAGHGVGDGLGDGEAVWVH